MEVNRNILKFQEYLRIPRRIMWDYFFCLFKINTEYGNSQRRDSQLRKDPARGHL